MKTEEVEKLVANLHDTKNYVVHTRVLKQALNYELVLKEVHRLIKLSQKSWLKSCIWKDFFKLANNEVLEYPRNHRDTKLIKNKARGNYLVSEPNYHTKRETFR